MRRPEARSPAGGQIAAHNAVSIRSVASFDPFHLEILTPETGQELVDYFSAKMTVHFPFVILSRPCSIDELARSRPCVCLSVLAAAAHGKVKLQRSLGSLFNDLVATRLATGQFHCLDMLQALLVHSAWYTCFDFSPQDSWTDRKRAHYQPRPRRYTQHLHLATSIISDMRLDRSRSKKPKLWSVDGLKDKSMSDWDADEMRALAGAYYLSSRYG